MSSYALSYALFELCKKNMKEAGQGLNSVIRTSYPYRFVDTPGVVAVFLEGFNNTDIVSSMNRFAKNIGQDVGQEILLKKEAILPEGRFVLGVSLGKNGNLDDWQSNFTFDGDFGFGIGFHPLEKLHPEWIAVTSFSLKEASAGLKTPEIEQLQAVKKNPNHSFLVGSQILESSYWERSLVHITTRWARQAGFESIMLQPGEENRWYKEGHIGLEQAQLRYNGTAKKCGFRKDESGRYVKSLRI